MMKDNAYYNAYRSHLIEESFAEAFSGARHDIPLQINVPPMPAIKKTNDIDTMSYSVKVAQELVNSIRQDALDDAMMVAKVILPEYFSTDQTRKILKVLDEVMERCKGGKLNEV